MINKNNQYLKKWPAGIIEIVNAARIIWKVEDPWCTPQHILAMSVLILSLGFIIIFMFPQWGFRQMLVIVL